MEELEAMEKPEEHTEYHTEYYTNEYGQTIAIIVTNNGVAIPRLNKDYFLSYDDVWSENSTFYWSEDNKLCYVSQNGLICQVYACINEDDTSARRYDIYGPKEEVTLPGGTNLVIYCPAYILRKVATITNELYAEDEPLFTYDKYAEHYYVWTERDGKYLPPDRKVQIDPYNEELFIDRCIVWNFDLVSRVTKH